ncbi:MAG: ABC transporter substrate-binding protein [Reyranella sp.]|nr:ABC transporter substrate-binding protein [Reyranella sp.]
MNRRTLITALGGTAVAWPVVSRGQSHMRKIGILVAGTPDPTAFLQEFRSSLRGLGYIEGQNIGVEVRSTGSTDPARLKAGAQELLALKVDVIVTLQTPPTEAAKAVTRDVPIVMGGVGDPVGTGIVASLVRPGGNITGVSAATPEVTAKNVELLHELLPAARRIGALCNANDPFSKQFLESIQNAARASNVEVRPVFAGGAPGVEAAFAELLTAKVDAVVVQPSLGVRAAAELSLKHRMPGASPSLPYARAGGLVAYTGNPVAMYRMSAVFTDKILKGAKPADLPIEQPTKFDMIINLKTATALGLTIPPTMLARADEVIE